MTDSVWLDIYIESCDGKPDRTMLREARQFAEWLDSREPTPQSVKEFMAKLQEEGYAQGTCRHYWAAIQALFKANHLTWSFQRGDAPQISERDVFAPALKQDVMELLIRSSWGMSREIQGYLALATTYGVRCGEIQQVGPTDFSWPNNLIFVESLKSGRQRWHQIAPAIKPVLQAALWRPRSEGYIWKQFRMLRGAAGLEGDRWVDVSVHSIRRGLFTMLSKSGLSDPDLKVFGRWKRSGKNMEERYRTSQEMGLDESEDTLALGLRDAEIDQRAFAANPLLKVWAERPT